jgi:hypothetical protein
MIVNLLEEKRLKTGRLSVRNKSTRVGNQSKGEKGAREKPRSRLLKEATTMMMVL